ncbi:hypothetical protein BJY16_003687 [Actinoplanes octamycinicus]|uniref:Uncharacterized protein n=1 Tax=Actinoplanes octamycinicus TaxID=135948 RepID=A0A7W7GXQ9_9ACTN|nr:hypothetical protein [Actinoplanes octamycinicus]MBB4740228.1 hypothetical protein [Actinoplanes octamycinicus]GIE59624.1 hypothetical protein Aoc01nite_50260 [Actinoplanes octamycinicus]
MTVRALESQLALHVESGVTLAGAGREDVLLRLGEHSVMIGVDHGSGQMLFRLPAEPRWDDNGELLPPDLAGNLREILGEISRFWKFEPVFWTIGQEPKEG